MRRLMVAVVTLAAGAALACPVCGQSATEQGQQAYITMSVIMSALPLFAIGGVVTWLVLRVRAAARAEQADLARRVTRLGPGHDVG